MNIWLKTLFTIMAYTAILVGAQGLLNAVYALTDWPALATAVGLSVCWFGLTAVRFWRDWKTAGVMGGIGFVLGFLCGLANPTMGM